LSTNLRYIGASLHLEARPPSSILIAFAERIHHGLPVRSGRDDRQILLFHLPQFFFPRSPAALNAFHRELTAQGGAGIGSPNYLAHGLVASAFDRDQISHLDIANAEQSRASWMDVISASQFQAAACAVLHVSEANRERQVNQLLDGRTVLRRAVFWRTLPRLDCCVVHNCSSRTGLCST
jgi:hypothetical protein